MASRKRTAEEMGDAALPTGICIGQKYKLNFSVSNEITALHYSFKPADIDNSETGSLAINAFKGEAVVSLKRQKRSGAEDYRGLINPDGNDKTYALAFNAETCDFSLQKVNTMVNQLKFREAL